MFKKRKTFKGSRIVWGGSNSLPQVREETIRGGGLILKLYSPQDSKTQLSANRWGEVNFFDNQVNKKDSRRFLFPLLFFSIFSLRLEP
jgi:hypothetical protein